MILGGRSSVSTAPHMAMLSATRYNPLLQPFYRGLVGQRPDLHRDTVGNAQEAGFRIPREEKVYLDA